MNSAICKCDKCGKELSNFEGRTAGCSHASCGGIFVAVPVRLIECGCCGMFHPEGSWFAGGSANYMNDCRYNNNRFRSDEDFTERTGLPCVEVPFDEQEVES